MTASGVAAASARPRQVAPEMRPHVDDTRGVFVIIFPRSLAASAEHWTQYRREQGWTVTSIEVPADSSSRDALAADIRDSIRNKHQNWTAREADSFAVLLLGDADDIPPWSFPQTEPSLFDANGPDYASDHPYQLMDDDDEQADIALGRVTVSRDGEALAVLEKIKAYEAADAAGKNGEIDCSQRRITYVAGEGRFGAADALMESLFISMVDTLVPPAFDLSMTFASANSVYCPPPSTLTDTVLDRLGEGALLFNYLGHGWARGFDSLHWMQERVPILRVEDLERLQCGPGQRPIALLTCCSAGWYDLPSGQASLAEAMLLHPAGPVAVIAASRPSHPYANTVLQKDVTELLLIDRLPTIGELDLRAMQSMLTIDAIDRQLDALARPMTGMMRLKGSLANCRLTHARMYNLLGDPATVIRRPPLAVRDLEFRDGVVCGRIDGMSRGKVVTTLESSRTTPVHAKRLAHPLGEHDAELERKALTNAPLANDRVVARGEAEVMDGHFEARLEYAADAPVSVIKVFASGQNDRGAHVTAFGARTIGSPAMPAAAAASE